VDKQITLLKKKSIQILAGKLSNLSPIEIIRSHGKKIQITITPIEEKVIKNGIN